MSQKEKNKTPPELDDQLEEAAAKEAAEEPAEAEAGATDPLMDELEALKDQAARQEEKYLRLAAEYDNFRKRTAKEKEAIWNDAKADAALAFLPVYDNLERALKQETADEAYKKGVEMTMNQLKTVLEKLGITEIEALGQPFDPTLHNAVMHIEDENFGENTVAEVFQAGFRLGDKVVRFAMEILEEQSRKTVHTAGITHLLEHPEYHSLDKAKPLMTYLSEESEASKLPVALDGGRNMNILIGPENVNEALKDTSVVMASYDIGDNMRGVIGVVGPTRMDYAKVTARLSYFADSLTRMFGKGELPSGDGDGQAQE